MVTPPVSVVLVTHDRPAWLALALQSVLAGEFGNFELIVSNNGDPLHTRTLAAQVGDPRIRWVEYTRDSRSLDHFVAALAQARGEFVALLHDDDWWSPHFLSALVPPLQARADAVLAFSDHYVIDGAGDIDEGLTEEYTRRWRAGISAGFHQPFFYVVARQSVPITGCVFRRESVPLSAFTAEVDQFLDIWLSYILAQTGGAAYYHGEERLLYYRIHGTSTSAARNLAGYLGAVRCRERMRADPRMHEYDDVLRERLARDHLSAGAAYLRKRARTSARAHLTASLRLRPSTKAVGGLAASWVAPGPLLERL